MTISKVVLSIDFSVARKVQAPLRTPVPLITVRCHSLVGNEAKLINVNVARLFLERPEEADQLGHVRLINLSGTASGSKRR
jgi:hypothetical protein